MDTRLDRLVPALIGLGLAVALVVAAGLAVCDLLSTFTTTLQEHQ